MKSIIDEIFLGKRGNLNEIKMNEEYWKRSGKGDKIFNELYEQLTDDQKKLLDDYADATGDAHAEAVSIFFKEGFQIGLLIGMEVNE